MFALDVMQILDDGYAKKKLWAKMLKIRIHF